MANRIQGITVEKYSIYHLVLRAVGRYEKDDKQSVMEQLKTKPYKTAGKLSYNPAQIIIV